MEHKSVLALPVECTLLAHVLEHVDDAMRVLVPREINGQLAALVAPAVDQLRKNVPAGRSAQQVACVEAGLWLLADDLHRCHEICQNIDTPQGSAWHAIMHRREGDFSNALYWWRRAGKLPWLNPVTGGDISEEARLLARGAGRSGAALELADQLEGAYDPAAFTRAVEAAHADPTTPFYAAAVRIGRLEFLSLLAQCWSK